MPLVKKLRFSEGTDVGAPTDLALSEETSSLKDFVDDAAYASSEGSPQDGSAYVNTTSDTIKFYSNGSWHSGGGGSIDSSYQTFTGVKRFQDGAFNQINLGSNADTTLTTSSNRVQIVAPTVGRTYELPSTGIKAGERWEFINKSAFVAATEHRLYINASDATQVGIVYPKASAIAIANVDDPVTYTDWEFISTESAQQATSWTPVIKVGSTTASNYTIDTAYFVRQRQNCYISVVFHLTANNGLTGDWNIDLPWDAVDQKIGGLLGNFIISGGTNGYIGTLNTAASVSRPKFYIYTTANSNNMIGKNLDDVLFGANNDRIQIDGWYQCTGG